MDGSSPKEEEELMEMWYNSIDRETNEPDNLARQQLEERIWNKVQAVRNRQTASDMPGIPERRSWWGNFRMKLVSAASVLLVLGSLYYASDYLKTGAFPLGVLTSDELSALTRVENNLDESEVISLSDGSRITLGPGSVFYYPKIFESGKRAVYLIGNGFFDIAKDPGRPFLVYTEDIVTKVVGTSFTINKDRAGNVVVAVMTGKVIVEKAQGSKASFEVSNRGVVLTPNKKVTLTNDAEKYVTGLVEKPVLLSGVDEFSKPDAFTFEETPLETVVSKLEKAYGVEIEILNNSITNCPITADLPYESLFAKLEIINALLNTKSEVKGTKIFLTGGECAPFKSIHENL